MLRLRLGHRPSGRRSGKWIFVDAAPDPEEPDVRRRRASTSARCSSRIEHAVKKIGAKRVSLDSLNALFVQFPKQPILRAELFRITTEAQAARRHRPVHRRADRRVRRGHAPRHRGVRRRQRDHPAQPARRRAAAAHDRDPQAARRAATSAASSPSPSPRATASSSSRCRGSSSPRRSSTKRVTSGVERLDEMCGGGIFRDSILLVSGATRHRQDAARHAVHGRRLRGAANAASCSRSRRARTSSSATPRRGASTSRRWRRAGGSRS